MSFGKQIIAGAIVLAAATAANAASYLGPAVAGSWDLNNYNANVAAGKVVSVYISGSTAVDTTITNVLAGNGTTLGLCASTSTTVGGVATTVSTLSVYYPSTTINNFTNRLFLCDANPSTTGLSAGTVLAVYKELTVGSANGVQPLLNIVNGVASTLNFVSASGLESQGTEGGCTGTGVGANNGGLNAASAPVLPYSEWVNCPNNATTVTTSGNMGVTGGVADVEARMLLTPAGGTINVNAVGSDLNSGPGLDVVWGVPVTKNVYYALQHAEGIVPTTACPANATSGTTANPGPTGNDSAACAPSLSKSQVAALYAGQITSWTQLGLSNAQTGTDNNVYLCRRDIGSGTEASYEAYFLGARCSKSALGMQSEDAQFIWASPGTGGVLSCLQAFYSGGNVTSYYVVGANGLPVTTTEPGGQWALGIASSELTPAKLASANDSFRMIAVDGVLPTLDNTINGFWPYFSTDALYTIKTGLTGANYPSSASVTMFGKIQGLIGHPEFTAANDATFANMPWGNGGDLAPASLFAATFPPTLPATGTTAAANPVNAMDKAPTGGVDNCNTPVIYSGISSAQALQSTLMGGNVNHP